MQRVLKRVFSVYLFTTLHKANKNWGKSIKNSRAETKSDRIIIDLRLFYDFSHDFSLRLYDFRLRLWLRLLRLCSRLFWLRLSRLLRLLGRSLAPDPIPRHTDFHALLCESEPIMIH